MKVQQTDTVKFLGVHIQSDLSWEKHCNEKANKMSESLAVLSKLKNVLPKKVMITIYHSLIETHLNYGILAWGNATKKSLKRLSVIQKRAIRMICKSKFNSHTEPLFKQLKLLKVEDLFNLACSKLYWKKVHNQLPKFHSLQLPTFEEQQNSNRQTRQSTDIITFPHRTNLDKQLFNYSVSKVWNQLPSNIKDHVSRSVNSFSNSIKTFLLSLYTTQCSLSTCYVCTNI
jgi:hypothetical protein